MMHMPVSTDARPIKSMLLGRVWNPWGSLKCHCGAVAAVTVAGRKKSLIDSLPLGGAQDETDYFSDIGKLLLFPIQFPVYRDLALFLPPSSSLPLQLQNGIVSTPNTSFRQTQCAVQAQQTPRTVPMAPTATRGFVSPLSQPSAQLPYRLIDATTQPPCRREPCV